MSARVSRRDFLRWSGSAFGVAMLAACQQPVAPVESGSAPPSRPFEGQTVSAAGMPWMWENTKPLYEEFLEETGMELNVATFQQQEITDKLMQAVATNTYFADLLAIPNNAAADIWGNDLALPVPEDLLNDPEMAWDDVLPVYREKVLAWKGVIYGMPHDGDTHHMMFLHSLMDDPDNQANFTGEYGYDLNPDRGPQTWQEHRDYAEFFTGWDWSGDGDPNYGFAHMMKRGDTAFWGFASRCTAYGKHPDDPGYFFDVETGAPRINSPAFVRGLTEWKDEMQFGPPGMISMGWGDVIEASQALRVAMNVGWDGVAMHREGSLAAGKSSYSVLPGSYEVYNAGSGQWESRSEINFAPSLAFGGWEISIAKGAENEDAAWALAKHFTNKEMGNTFAFQGFKNPIRISDIADIEPWVEIAGFTERSATTYLRALNETMTHPNLVLNLRIPGWTQYRDALELAVSKALAGEASPENSLNEAAEAWSAITDRLGGPEKQRDNYRTHLGLD